MIVIGTGTAQRALRIAVGIVFVLITGHFLASPAQSAILPLPTEQESWSDMAFPSGVSGSYNSGTKTLTVSGTPSNDLEIGQQFGPSNPGRHYGTGGTLGGPFSATLNLSGVIVQPDGSVSNGGTVSVVYGGSAPGSIVDDYGISSGATLLQGSVLEVLLGATGANTLDVLFSISGGALQNDNPDPNVGVFGPINLGVLRIAGVTMPNNWSGSFSLNGATIDALGVPEPSGFILAGLATLFMSLPRPLRRP
jgi:hypothetical protein